MFLGNKNALSTGDILAALTLVSFLTPALFDLGRVFEYWHGAQLAAEKVERVFNKGPIIRAPEKGARKRVSSSRLRISGLHFGEVSSILRLHSKKKASRNSTFSPLMLRHS